MAAQRKRESFPDTGQVRAQGEEARLYRVFHEEVSPKILVITFMAEALRARLEASQSPEATSALEIKERLAEVTETIRSKLNGK